MGEASTWAMERFGSHAEKLTESIPKCLAEAHARARASHEASGLEKFSKYGHVLAERALVELAEAARALGTEPRVLRGREFAVIVGHALFPLRYANRAQPLEKARLKSSASLQRRRLLTAHAPQQAALFDIDDDLTTDEYEELHRTYEELGATTKLVSVFFTSDVDAGIHQIWWGEATLEPDRTFSWAHKERLPVSFA